jgi:hypothetical protein
MQHNYVIITNLQTSWVSFKSMRNLLCHRFVLFKHGSNVHDFHM